MNGCRLQAGMSVQKSTQEYLKKHSATLVYIWPIGSKAPELVYMPLNPQILLSANNDS
ncbi:hypothetical protein [Brevibacillus laterosporus]|uniref:hypothetical protein n=1 Tax=Brevibacillus laterosporus TaxID=1465 RepID=UPI0015950306|nr:hypothetical protein [Brevibacillus laterosporus]